MRIIQIIDSLEVGGAERMAVNYANTLVQHINFSGLVVTRTEGSLLNQIDKNVSYLYLRKKKSFDFYALFRLRKYVKKNEINIVHAHGTSFFIAVLLKITYPKIKIIWHEHFGARVNETLASNFILFFFSFCFSSVFVVNEELKVWAKKNLLTKNISYIPNFAMFSLNIPNVTSLKGENGRRIVCLANLKTPKNHIVLLTAFKELKLDKLGWSLHLIGKDYKDQYSNQLKEYIKKNNLINSIFIYDSRNDIKNILSQATIGVLVSTSEGFPVSLLEYGLFALPTLSTNVGSCSEIIIDNRTGLLFDPKDKTQLKNQLNEIVLEKSKRDQFGLHLQELVLEKFSKNKILELIISKYEIVQND